MLILFLSIIVAIIICIVWFVVKIFPSKSKSFGEIEQEQRDEPNLSSSEKDQLRRRLLNMAMGDKGVVNRLIEFERKKNPSATEKQIIESAIQRWENDNSRN